MIRTILLVDDDLAILTMLFRALHKEPYEILYASSAPEAIQEMESHDVDVLVSDDRMPGIQGSDFLAQIRILFPGTVRIMLTGIVTPESMAKAVNNGHVFLYLTKPCPPEILAEAIRQALAQKVLFDRCREALRLLSRQTLVLKQLAQSHPAMLAKSIEAIADITVASDDFYDAVDLAEQMEVHTQYGSDLFPALKAPITSMPSRSHTSVTSSVQA